MAYSTIPADGLSLCTDTKDEGEKSSSSAIVFNLSDALLQDVKDASNTQGGLQLLTGNPPKIRLGKRVIDLSVSPESFRHELYIAFPESRSKLEFAGIVSHRAQLNLPQRKESLGSDVALAALKSTLATLKEEKQATQTNISAAVLPLPKGRRGGALEPEQARKRGLSIPSQPGSPSLGATPIPSQPSATSSVSTTESAAKAKAMRTAVLHLLAMRPLPREDILHQTHIPQADLDDVLQRLGTKKDGKWQLTDKAFRDLDVWTFRYSSRDARQAAIDNAIRAYDRQRIGKDEKIWQMLLPKKERGKGIVLSKLHLGQGNASRSLTPRHAMSPDATLDDGDATPRLNGALSPRPGQKGAGLTKRLFAKDPQKQRAADQAKEKKRKDREAAKVLSDTEGAKPARKKQTTDSNNPKIKSAEFVHSSDDESSEEAEIPLKDLIKTAKPATVEPKSATPKAPKPVDRSKSTSHNSDSPISKSNRPKTDIVTKSKLDSPTKTSATSPTLASSKSGVVGKSTPNGLTAPVSQHRKSQLSPQKGDSKPTVPSPLGAARPRVASDVSDRGAVGVQRVRQGAETPKGLGITNGLKTSHNSASSVGSNARKSAIEEKRRSNGSDSRKSPITNDISRKLDSAAHRQRTDSATTPNGDHHPIAKHRQSDSTSSLLSPGDIAAAHDRSNSIVDSDRSSSDDSTSILDNITFNQGVTLGQRFQQEFYPRYVKMYDEQAEMKARGEKVPRADYDRLLAMHQRLQEMKAQMQAASDREHVDE